MNITETSSTAVAAKAETLSEVCSDWLSLVKLGEQHGKDRIAFVNIGRKIGLSMQMLCLHRQLRMSFFENIKSELPAGLDFTAAQRCIKLANALPQPVTTLQEANSAWEQQMFYAIGIDEEPKRIGTQSSHDSTPDTFIWHAFASLKDKLVKRIEDAPTWDAEMRESVRDHIKVHKVWLNELEAKL